MTNNTPTFIAYTVTNREGDKKDLWTQVGAAWEHDHCTTIRLSALPVNGELVLRKPRTKKEADTHETDENKQA